MARDVKQVGIHGFIDLLPLLLPAMLAAFGSVAVGLLLVGKLDNMLVWPLGSLTALLAGWIVYAGKRKLIVDTPERRSMNLIVLAMIVLWVGFNIFYTAQHVFTNRDPGVYATAAAHLIEDNDLSIATTTVFGDSSRLASNSGGFAPVPGEPGQLHAQGAHLLPALMGLSGRIVGPAHMLRLNVLIGGIALLAVYAFGRQLLRPRWAALATAAVSLMLPMMYFSRDSYTEPLLMAFTFGALALLWSGQKTGKKSLWFLAGLVAGAGTMARIDAYTTIAVFVLLAAAVLVVSRAFRTDLRQVLSLLLGLGITSVLGWLDVSRLSRAYYQSEENIRLEFLLILVVGVIGIAAVILARHTKAMQKLDVLTKSWRGLAAALFIVLSMVFLASRPLWYTSYTERSVGAITSGTIQTEPSRNFYEQSVNWAIWYLGPVTVVLAVLGLAVAARRAFKETSLLLFAPVTIITGTALLYFTQPSINPDQIWASRRLLPIILPGFILFAVFALQRLHDRQSLKIFSQRIQTATLAGALGALVLVGPLFVSWLFLRTREATWYQPVQAVCQTTRPDHAILWIGAARTQLVEPTKALCLRPSQGYGRLFINTDTPTKGELAEAAREARDNGYVPLIGLFSNDSTLLESEQQRASITPVASFSYHQIEQTFERPPTRTITVTNGILLGTIEPDGSITKL